ARSRQKPGCDHQQRALAAAARTEDRQKLAAPLAHRNLVERAHRTVTSRINLANALQAQIGLIRLSACRGYRRHLVGRFEIITSSSDPAVAGWTRRPQARSRLCRARAPPAAA